VKAIRLTQIGQPLEEQDIPLPELGSQDVLVSVHAAGICHSDAHYRAGTSSVGFTPITLGHETAGVVAAVGSGVTAVQVGDRVCVHYMATCGACTFCAQGQEQFCTTGQMIGKHRDGGYAEYVAVPARSTVPLPDEIPFEQGAIMMCSSATSFHALRKARLQPNETVAVFGVGGLGMSAIQLARIYGARAVYAVDVNPRKLSLAQEFGAIPVNPLEGDPVSELMRQTYGTGVDVALELAGLPLTTRQAVQSLAVFGRAILVGITDQAFQVYSYTEVLGKEAEIIGSSDHLISELPTLLDFARRGLLDLTSVITRTVPLQAAAVNEALDDLDRFGESVRTVIVP
jgi:2-desacetyl-2-hydroxyethyl bacteriochlorophyllide A dehydrogenase